MRAWSSVFTVPILSLAMLAGGFSLSASAAVLETSYQTVTASTVAIDCDAIVGNDCGSVAVTVGDTVHVNWSQFGGDVICTSDANVTGVDDGFLVNAAGTYIVECFLAGPAYSLAYIHVTANPSSPGSTDACKNDGWRSYGRFKNQGDCVSFVATGGRH